jgi:hypothetical protein
VLYNLQPDYTYHVVLMQSSYSEAIRILYSRPTFLFQDPQDVLYFASTTRPECLDLVQFMEIAWDGDATKYIPGSQILKRPLADYKAWPEAWRAIEKMKGLKEMRVRLKVSTLLRYGLTRRMLYESVRNVTGLDVFQLIVKPGDLEN